MTLARHSQMTADAARRPALWRLLMGIATIFATLLIWVLLLLAARAVFTGQGFAAAAAEILAIGSGGPAQTILFLLVIAGLGVGTLIAAAVWQKRSPASLIGPPAITLRHATIAALVSFLFLGGLAWATLPLAGPVQPNLPLSIWLIWLLPALVALILQTGSEELLFRGYLQSQLAARTGNQTLAILLPSFLFGFAHYVPTFPVLAALSYVLLATLFGILAADLTARTGSIGAAWGFHLSNNALGVLILSPDPSFDSLSLWRASTQIGPELIASPLATLEILILVANWYLIRRVLHV